MEVLDKELRLLYPFKYIPSVTGIEEAGEDQKQLEYYL